MEMCVMVRKGKGVRHFQTEYPLTDGGGLIISIIRACPLLSLLAQHTASSMLEGVTIILESVTCIINDILFLPLSLALHRSVVRMKEGTHT